MGRPISWWNVSRFSRCNSRENADQGDSFCFRGRERGGKILKRKRTTAKRPQLEKVPVHWSAVSQSRWLCSVRPFSIHSPSPFFSPMAAPIGTWTESTAAIGLRSSQRGGWEIVATFKLSSALSTGLAGLKISTDVLNIRVDQLTKFHSNISDSFP